MSQQNILITGGAGFIGSHLVRRFVTKYPGNRIINLDLLTYAGNLANLKDIEHEKKLSVTEEAIYKLEKVENGGNEFDNQIRMVTMNIGALNAVIEMTLKDANSHLKTLNNFYYDMT